MARRARGTREGEFSARAAVVRKGRGIKTAVACAVTVLLLGYSAVSLIDDVARRFGEFGIGTVVYRRSLWGSTVALAALDLLLVALAVWAAALTVRVMLGLPRPRNTEARVFFSIMRVLIAAPIVATLAIWSSDEIYLRWTSNGATKAFLLGASMILMLAYDVPRLIANVGSCVRAIRPLRGVGAAKIGRLPAGQRVLVHGTIEATPDHRGAWVYQRRLADLTAAERVEAVPFVLRDGPHTVLVELEPSRVIVQTALVGTVAELAVGAHVGVIGVVSATGDGAYRSGPPHLSASADAPVYVFPAGAPMRHRLVVAATVEALAAVGLLGCLVGLITVWLWAGSLV